MADRCARCGAEFCCGMTEGKSSCWCAELPAVMPVPKEGEGACLCPSCLREDVAKARLSMGQCLDCRHRRALTTKGGGAIVHCGAEGYPRYPRLPVSGCEGFAK
jgi:hypothetical protein